MNEHTNDPNQRPAEGPTDVRPSQPRRSPRAVRTAAFDRRMRGYDEDEVREFLSSLGDEIETADAERTALRAEVERLRHEQRVAESGVGGAVEEIDPQAVALFSQAQQVADRVVAEAVQHAKDLMENAREQQRDILKKAHSAAELAAAKAAEASPAEADPAGMDANGQRDSSSQDAQGNATSYDRPVQEIEYVRTFARVAQVQLKSVLDALTEQVERLGELPDLSEEGRGSQEAPSGSGTDRAEQVGGGGGRQGVGGAADAPGIAAYGTVPPGLEPQPRPISDPFGPGGSGTVGTAAAGEPTDVAGFTNPALPGGEPSDAHSRW